MNKESLVILCVGLLLAIAGLVIGGIALYNIITPEHQERVSACKDAGGVFIDGQHCVPVINLSTR